MAEIKLCDQTDAATGEPCKQPAAVSYRWDWGQSGACCHAHANLLQQTAQSLSSHDLKRNVSCAPLEHAQEAPLERSERTALIAAKLSAEAEADEIKRRGAELYRQNVDLTGQVSTLTFRNQEANAQLEHAQEQIKALQRKLDDRELDLATVTNELQRLQTLAAFAPDTTVTGGKSEKPAKGAASKGAG